MNKNCSHEQGDHNRQFQSYTLEQINQLLRKVLDTEILFSLFFKEQDANAKQIYYFLFKLLRKSILNLKEHSVTAATTTTPTQTQTSTTNGSSSSSSPLSNLNSIPAAIEAHLGRPPFDEPSITKAVVNFLFVKVI